MIFICYVSSLTDDISAVSSWPMGLCSEIFLTRDRGLCIALWALVYWIGDRIVTYTSTLQSPPL
ncbi:hypothetical protein CIPAW_07G134600 [Carya illinoinensis]|uniref:Uncharacterized protein n=1 Tax=Carya illinoinensis TaxID=32201 RepID=A0A8T1Q4R3_CARIL|nr:hypothetical protein CIPAW_07G134600 [Carya illinoinensis]